MSALAAAAFLFRAPTRVPAPEPIAAAPVIRIVRTLPLAVGESVRTSGAFFTTVQSEPGSITQIETRTSAPMLDYLSDEQLLAAFLGQHPALFAPGTPDAQLVFY